MVSQIAIAIAISELQKVIEYIVDDFLFQGNEFRKAHGHSWLMFFVGFV